MANRRNFILILMLLVSVLNVFCETLESENANSTTRRRRFTRASTTATTEGNPITNEEEPTVNKESSSLEYNNETFASHKESFDVTSSTLPSPIHQVTKKPLRVRNCGERIGDDIPFIALLVHTNPYDVNSKRTLSKGVLISENFVLTTVSSVYHSESLWTVSSVRLGDFVTWNKYANRDKRYSVEVDVDEIYFHKKRDIALIKLKESVNFTDIIRPACLPQSDNYNFKELQTHLCKRNRQHNKAPADVTMEFAAPLSSFDCRKFFSRKHITISQYEFCVWDETGDDCAGDIATALFSIHNGRLYVVGLRSYAETDDEDIADPSEYPGIYIKVGSYLEWISAIFNADSRN